MSRRLGFKLAMRVLQSDLYRQLDDAERAECDELTRAGGPVTERATFDTAWSGQRLFTDNLLNRAVALWAWSARPPCDVDGSWLWCELMAWCKKKGIAPASESELFAIVGRAHAAKSAKAAETQTGYVIRDAGPTPMGGRTTRRDS